MDHGLEALVGFVGAQGDAFEFLEFAEEVFDQMTPFVHLGVDLERRGAAWMPRNHDLGAALVELSDDVVAVRPSAINAANSIPAMSGGTPTVSKRYPGSSTKRTRLPSASVRARILVVMPPLERPMAWLWVPLLRLVRDGGP
jgi:hypothetical protein